MKLKITVITTHVNKIMLDISHTFATSTVL